MDKELKLVHNYRLEKRIGSGAFGEIYLAKHITTHQSYAVKIEPVSTKHPQLKYEEKIYSYLKGGKGIPNVYFYGEVGDYYCMVMDILGRSLEELFCYCNKQFSLKTVLMLGDQMLQRIEFVHNNSFIHRDIKPDNFLMGSGSNQHILYIIDFGLSKRFIDPRTGEHIPYRDGKSLTGTARYASLNTHIGQEQARRDDIESIAFVMVYFLKGKLPWQGVVAKDKDDKYKLIKEKKIETPITELASDLPPQFLKFFELVRNIGFEDAPDYISLRTLLAEMFDAKGYQNDFKYDWVLEPNLGSKKNRYHSQNQGRNKGGYHGRNNFKPHHNEHKGKHKHFEDDPKLNHFNKKKYSRQVKEDYDAHKTYHKNQDFDYYARDDKHRRTHDGFGGKGRYNKQNYYDNKKHYQQEGDGKNAGGYNRKHNDYNQKTRRNEYENK